MAAQEELQGRHLTLTGQVQGVGFRPFVHHLGQRLGLSGRVSNDASGVQIEVLGSADQLDAFERGLWQEAPPMALIDGLERRPAQVIVEPGEFEIVASGAGEVKLSVTPDAAVCSACVSELFDPANRRYRYPFINCTHCGPRYSLIRQLPYDRPHTTMAAFDLCARCAAEYAEPADRRFHAQPTCCGDCGPKLELRAADGAVVPEVDPIAAAVARIQGGEILAIKGVGGFHLVCDANAAAAVARLRARKQRDQKPFAVMGANLPSLQRLARVSPANADRLRALDAPIVLCPAQPGAALPEVAPGLNWIGLMLPHAPLHYLLFHQAAGQPSGTAWLEQPQSLLLVMTSANRSGEPLITDNQQALAKLAGIADGWLLHDREIHIRCDDSVLHGGAEPPALIRRGRGLAPRVIAFAEPGPPVLALGSYFKNTLCLTRDNRAYVSQYLGDLANAEACRALEQCVDHLRGLLQIQPQRIAVDRHPDFYSSRLGRQLAAEWSVPLVEVQHHHAHVAAVMAEHQLRGPVLGVALDGLGLGDNGELWGGELLRVDGGTFERLARLRPIALPGGDRAAKEPWRLAASVLHQLGRTDEITARFADQPGADLVRQMLERDSNCPPTSSAGRWFDAAAGILGIKAVANYEAQPAMMLEGLAESHGSIAEEPLHPQISAHGELDLLPLFARLLEVDNPAYGAALFQAQLSRALAEWTCRQAERNQIQRVVLAGGCFLNQLLRRQLQEALTRRGLEVFCAERLPCNDGGISLGQAWVAIAEANSQAGRGAR